MMSNSTIKNSKVRRLLAWKNSLNVLISYMAWFGWQIEAWHQANKGLSDCQR